MKTHLEVVDTGRRCGGLGDLACEGQYRTDVDKSDCGRERVSFDELEVCT